MFIRDKVETRFGADDVFFQHKTVGVEQKAQVDIAVGNGVDRCAGVDARQAFTQFLCFACDVGFRQQNTVGVANLGLGDGELVHLLIGMYRIHQRNHAVQQVALA